MTSILASLFKASSASLDSSAPLSLLSSSSSIRSWNTTGGITPTDADQTVIAWLRGCASIASIIGGALIILSYAIFPRTRTYGRKLLCILSSQDLLVAVAYILPGQQDQWLCRAQSVFISFFALTSMMWTTCIAWYIYRSVHVASRTDRSDQYQNRFHVITWGYSAICGAYVAIFPEVEYGGMWCWISDDGQAISKLLLFYIPLWILWIANIVLYSLASLEIKRLLNQAPADASNAGIKRLRQHRKLVWIPLIIVLLRIAGSAHRLYDSIENAQPLTTLVYLQAFGDPSQGWVDAVLFLVLNESIRRHFIQCLTRPCQKQFILPGSSVIDDTDQEGDDDDDGNSQQMSHPSAYGAIGQQQPHGPGSAAGAGAGGTSTPPITVTSGPVPSSHVHHHHAHASLVITDD